MFRSAAWKLWFLHVRSPEVQNISREVVVKFVFSLSGGLKARVLPDVKPGAKYDNGGAGGVLLVLGSWLVREVYTTTRVPQFIRVWHRRGQPGQSAVGSRRRGGGVDNQRDSVTSVRVRACVITLHLLHLRHHNRIRTWQLFSLPSSLLSVSVLCFLSLLYFQQDYLQGDSSKAHKILGWRPKVTFEVRCHTPGEVTKSMEVLLYKYRLGILWGNWIQPQRKQCPTTKITKFTQACKDLLWLS